MFNPIFTITLKINQQLIEIERVRGFLDAIKLKEDWLLSIQQEALILESHASTHIEGNPLTIDQARMIITGNQIEGVTQDDEKELLNYTKALDLVSQYMGKEDPITEGLIRAIHKMLVKDVRGEKACPGVYRKIQNYVVNSRTSEIIYTPPPAYNVPAMMQELVSWINKKNKGISSVLTAAIAQFQFVQIHPFLDGNGRTARLLSTLILYKTGYDFKRLFTLSEYYDKDRSSYYHAIQTVREHDMDMTPWLEYFILGLYSQMRQIQEKSTEMVKYERVFQKAKIQNISNRQSKALKYIINNGSISRLEYVSKIKVSLRTANYDLKDLENKGLIKQTGIGRSTKYIIAQ